MRSDGKFQVRDYPALTVVETPMAAANGSDGSFMRLFRFITGANEGQQKISMTTPVFMSGSETNTTMAFVMPAKMKTGDAPKPSDGAVTVREDGARAGGGAVRGAALQRRAQREEGSGVAGATEGVDGGGEAGRAVVAGVWLFRSAVDAGLPAPQRGDAADQAG